MTAHEDLPIDLLALDVDGTMLFGPDGTIEARTTQAIRDIEDRGVVVVIATGRRWPTAMRVLEPLGAADYLIQSNGAVVRRIADKKVLHTQYLAKGLGMEVLGVTRRLGLSGVWFDIPGRTGFLYVDGPVEGNRPLEIYASSNPTAFVPLQSFDDLGDAMEIVVFGQEPVLREAMGNLETELSEPVKVIPWVPERLGGLVLEVLAAGASKGSALEWLAGWLGFERDRVLAIGDDVNDLEMIEWAGTGVAMGNAKPAVKAAADLVIGRCDESGLAVYLEGLV